MTTSPGKPWSGFGANRKRKNGLSQNGVPPLKRRKQTQSNSKPQPDPFQVVWSSPKECLQWLLSNPSNSNTSSSSSSSFSSSSSSTNTACDEDDIVSTFISDFWGQKPFLLKRNDATYYKQKGVDLGLDHIYNLIDASNSSDDLKPFRFGDNIICKCYDTSSGTETDFTRGDACAAARGTEVKSKHLKELFESSEATIQLLHPHFYHYEMSHVMHNLESFFGNFVGSNVYVTPCKQQGLRPHWDDIEAIILQLRGSKRWRLFAPVDQNDALPMEQSYGHVDVDNKEKYQLLLDCVLHTGDLLYFPRGVVHYAQCVESDLSVSDDVKSEYSLHLTISTNQNHSHGDFLKMFVNECVSEAICGNVDLRRNLPVNIIASRGNQMNVKQEGGMSEKKSEKFEQDMGKFVKSLSEFMSDKSVQRRVVNKVCDEMGKQFVCNRFPPPRFLPPSEFVIYGKDENRVRKMNLIEKKMTAKDELIEKVEDEGRRRSVVNQDTIVRLCNPDWMRIITAGGGGGDKGKDEMQKNEINGKNMKNENEDEGDEDVLAFLEENDELESKNDELDDMEENGQSALEWNELTGNHVLMYSCVQNSSKTHLMAFQNDCSSAPMAATKDDKPIFVELRQAHPNWIQVKDIIEKTKVETERCCDLLFGMWADGILECKN